MFPWYQFPKFSLFNFSDIKYTYELKDYLKWHQRDIVDL